MKANRKFSVLGTVLTALVFGLLVISAGAMFMYFSPLDPPMAVEQENTPAPAVVAAAENIAPENNQKAQEVCGNTGSMLVLFTGEDFSKGVAPLGADSVRVVKVDFSNKKIIVVGFPRDLWVKTAGLAGQNFPETRLGLAYHYKKEATSGSDQHKITTATTQIAQALYDNFGLRPDKYLTIQLQNTPAFIDTIGGLDINVPQAFTSQYGVSFSAGSQHMDGAKATEYVRSWSEDKKEGDLLRFPRQNVFIKAVQDKVLTADILAKVPDLYKQFDKSIVTDLSPKQIADLACMAKEVPQKDITFHEIVPTDLVTEQADRALMPNVEKIKAALKAWFDL